jgi:outer membrane protein OmpA-like peptidoglycan-associated protein
VPLLLEDSPLKFNVDLGVGSGLVRARSATYNTNGRFSFSENMSAGLSLDIPVEDLGVLSFGFRNTYFIDDYIDATPVEGTSNDQLLRFFTSARVPLGPSAKTKAKIAEAEDLAASLRQTLESTKLEASENAAKASAQIQGLESQVQNMGAELAEFKKAPKQQYILQSVLFEINSSEVRPTDVPELTSLQALLANNTELTATIIGHTDDSGPAAFNEKLSLDRASTVKSWLVAKGIDASRLTIKGASSTSPIVPNSQESTRAVNRRTEIILK